MEEYNKLKSKRNLYYNDIKHSREKIERKQRKINNIDKQIYNSKLQYILKSNYKNYPLYIFSNPGCKALYLSLLDDSNVHNIERQATIDDMIIWFDKFLELVK